MRQYLLSSMLAATTFFIPVDKMVTSKAADDQAVGADMSCRVLSNGILDAPPILMSQTGFAPHDRKIAILRTNHEEPVRWQVYDADGEIIASGSSLPFGRNETSGDAVHQIDLSALKTTGTAYRIKACGAESRPFAIQSGTHRNTAFHTLKYFYHNRSGEPIISEYVQDPKWSRPISFADNNIATCFSGKDKKGNIWPACDYSLDIKGGWFDAGDFGKYVVNGGIAVWALQDTYERAPSSWPDGSANIPESGNDISDLLDEARQELEFLLAMLIPDGKKVPAMVTDSSGHQEITVIDGSGLVHHKTHGLKWAGFPMRPENSTAKQYVYPPSTAATLNLAAAAAQGARLWRKYDTPFAEKALHAAKKAFDAALKHPNLFADDYFDGGGAYRDNNASDEFSWAAAELFSTTGDNKYLQYIERGHLSPQSEINYINRQDNVSFVEWSRVGLLAAVAIVRAEDRFPKEYVSLAKNKIVEIADFHLQTRGAEGYAFPLPKNAFTWGSAGLIANNAMILATAFDITNDVKYRGGVIDAVDFLLGRNVLDQSFISGIGERAMKNPHHRFWGHSLDATLPPPPPGAVSGGPNNRNFADPVAKTLDPSCPQQTCWLDHADAFSLNEVAINWNAPVFWITSFLHDTEKPDQ